MIPACRFKSLRFRGLCLRLWSIRTIGSRVRHVFLIPERFCGAALRASALETEDTLCPRVESLSLKPENGHPRYPASLFQFRGV